MAIVLQGREVEIFAPLIREAMAQVATEAIARGEIAPSGDPEQDYRAARRVTHLRQEACRRAWPRYIEAMNAEKARLAASIVQGTESS